MAIMGYFGTRNRRERHDIDIVNISQNDRLSQLDPSFFPLSLRITMHLYLQAILIDLPNIMFDLEQHNLSIL